MGDWNHKSEGDEVKLCNEDIGAVNAEDRGRGPGPAPGRL